MRFRELCGYGSSVIACDAEAGRERDWSPAETPMAVRAPQRCCSDFQLIVWRKL